METLDILKEKRQAKKVSTEVKVTENKLILEVEEVAKKYLLTAESRLLFEVKPTAVDAMLEIKDKQPLINKYDIYQTDVTLFEISLKHIDI